MIEIKFCAKIIMVNINIKGGGCMSENLVITIGREFGSGGHEIAKRLSKLMNINMYDKDIIRLAAKNSGYDEEILRSIDETATNSLLYSLSVDAHQILPIITGEHNMPITDRAFIVCSKIIRELAEKESCIIVGRCADSILRGRKNLLTVFIHADIEFRVNRISEYEKISRNEALGIIKKADKKRANYHNYYSDTKWGSCKAYDLCINSRIGFDKAAEIIKHAAESILTENT